MFRLGEERGVGSCGWVADPTVLTAAKHAGWARFGLIVLALGLEGA